MSPARKLIRQRLKDCSRAEYRALTDAAKLSPVQKSVLDLFIVERLPISEIAFRLSFCESLVRLRLAQAYDNVFRAGNWCLPTANL